MKVHLLFLILAALGFFGISRAQEPENHIPSATPISANIRQEIIHRILVFKFKPAKRPKVIYLAQEGINPSWLPSIRNIEFRLLSDQEIEDRETKVYFFTEPEMTSKPYSISFAFGVGCDYTSNYWSFRLAGNKLKLWYAGEGGGFCGSGGDGNFKTAGKLNTYPNELKGYQFFNQGKLKNLKLAISTKEDVKKNFGSDCERGCDYNADWTIRIAYFGTLHRETTIDNKLIKYIPKEEYLGRIYSIQFSPKPRISFSCAVFPNKFGKSGGYAIGHGIDSSGRITAGAGTAFDIYLDRYGLKYTIFEKVNGTGGKAETATRNPGDLMSIEYSIPERIKETMFVYQQ